MEKHPIYNNRNRSPKPEPIRVGTSGDATMIVMYHEKEESTSEDMLLWIPVENSGRKENLHTSLWVAMRIPTLKTQQVMR